jgi:hypothetical protein
MPHTNDPESVPRDPWRDAALRRTRGAVLNVLVAVGLMIALSGWLIRRRAEAGIVDPSRGLHDGLLAGLFGAGIASYLLRRRRLRYSSQMPMDRRIRWFYWTHVGAAAIAAIGVPLGLAYGWWVDPRLEAVIPFWVVPLALGFLAIPRHIELEDLDPSTPNPEAPPR